MKRIILILIAGVLFFSGWTSGQEVYRWVDEKGNSGDLEERKLWDDYMKAFEAVISATSTKCAPWDVVPANRKWYRNLVVGDQVVGALEGMNLKTPPAPEGVDFSKLKIV